MLGRPPLQRWLALLRGLTLRPRLPLLGSLLRPALLRRLTLIPELTLIALVAGLRRVALVGLAARVPQIAELALLRGRLTRLAVL